MSAPVVAYVTFGPNVYGGRRMGETQLAVREQTAAGLDFWRSAATGIVYKDHEISEVRPLVVIDPEDVDETSGLADLFCDARWSHIEGSDECDPLTRASMREALARFANGERSKYPKPDEPTGLGAVVEDTDGNRWVRVNATHFAGESSPMNRLTYGEIDAVRVLTKGVSA